MRDVVGIWSAVMVLIVCCASGDVVIYYALDECNIN